MQKVAGAFPPEVKRLGREAKHLTLSSREIKKMSGTLHPFPYTPS
jgi:hypothetical protein